MRVRRVSVRRGTRVSLSHSQRDVVAQEVGIMHQVWYSSSVSTFCWNKITDMNYRGVHQHIFTSFSFSGKKWFASPLLDVILVGNFPQPPLTKKKKSEPPQNHQSLPLGKLWMLPYNNQVSSVSHSRKKHRLSSANFFPLILVICFKKKVHSLAESLSLHQESVHCFILV